MLFSRVGIVQKSRTINLIFTAREDNCLRELKMANFGVGLVLLGILTALVGVGGFFDTRKVDRRFKTGYKNNEPDNRNFGRSAKRVLYGIGICIIGAAITSLSSPSGQGAPSASAVDVAASAPKVVSESAPASSNVVQLDPTPAEQKADSGVTLGSNERVVIPETGADPNTPKSITSVGSKGISPQVSTASVSCIEDGTFFGTNVCKSGTLAAAYDREVKEYEEAQARIGGKDVGVRIEQENWLDKVTRGCSDMTCLTDAFDARIADLHGRYRKDS
ncbi:lipoprotein-like protein [Paraburkholderia atlantica]|uniref:Lipoprotein-like protein n=2 Tax=Paraburkholderia atlantica TaxID=2654982 RepID=D5WBZ0_PARAM|nr:lipoprotein-like protein [Paraburkholderia atlantica]